MIYEDTDSSRRLNTAAGSIVFFAILAGGTYLFQSTLVLVKCVSTLSANSISLVDRDIWRAGHIGVALPSV
jgi:hypothetical protein